MSSKKPEELRLYCTMLRCIEDGSRVIVSYGEGSADTMDRAAAKKLRDWLQEFLDYEPVWVPREGEAYKDKGFDRYTYIRLPGKVSDYISLRACKVNTETTMPVLEIESGRICWTKKGVTGRRKVDLEPKEKDEEV